jgi:hypothetical protein
VYSDNRVHFAEPANRRIIHSLDERMAFCDASAGARLLGRRAELFFLYLARVPRLIGLSGYRVNRQMLTPRTTWPVDAVNCVLQRSRTAIVSAMLARDSHAAPWPKQSFLNSNNVRSVPNSSRASWMTRATG